MKRMIGVLAVAALAGIMSISSVEAAPKHKTPPPHPVKVEHHKPLHHGHRHVEHVF